MRIIMVIMAAMALAGCATFQTGLKVVAQVQHDGLSERVVAVVKADGSFNKQVNTGCSRISVSGHVVMQEDRFYKVTYAYECSTKDYVMRTITRQMAKGIVLLRLGAPLFISDINEEYKPGIMPDPATAAFILTLITGESSGNPPQCMPHSVRQP